MSAATSPKRLAAAIVAVASALGFVAGVAALDWPLPDPRIAANFGTEATGRVVTGVALAAADGIVRAAEEGEVLFSAEEGKSASALPWALGSFIVVEHQRQMTAVYSHLAPGSVSDYLKRVKAGDILGRAGASGWAEGPGTLFQVLDRKEGRWVNPLLLLPRRPDDKAPSIRSLVLLRDGTSYPLGETPAVSQGTYALAIEASDPADADWTAGPLAPYSIRLSIDGQTVAKAVFDVASCSDGKLMLFSSEPRAAGALRGGEGRYILAERLLTRGRIGVEAVVEDAAGNRRSASWSIVVE